MTETDQPTELLAIDPRQLSSDALRGVIEEFVSRSGTDYGLVEASLEAKVEAVAKQLENGEAILVFNSDENSCEIVAAETWQQSQVEPLV